MALVTLAQAKRQLQIWTDISSPLDEVDLDITDKLAEAESIIIDYLKDRADESWDEDTVPGFVRSAVLQQLTELYRFRGDDTEGPKYEDGQLSPTVTNLLRRRRDPALA